MLSRMADALFWMARNIERADNTARLIEINLLHLVEAEESHIGEAQWAPLLAITSSENRFAEAGARPIDKKNVVNFLTQDGLNENSILNCLRVARENARVVRDRISKEMWEAVNYLWLSSDAMLKKPLTPERAPLYYAQLRGDIARFKGWALDTMMRGEAYGFYSLGNFLERADMTCRILDVKYHILLPTPQPVGSALDYYQWAALLRSLSGFEAFRQSYHAGLRPIDVSEFILFSPVFPRSLRYCVDHLLGALPFIGFTSPAQVTCQALQTLSDSVEKKTAEEVFRQGLHEFLQEELQRIAAVNACLQRECFEAYLGDRVALSH